MAGGGLNEERWLAEQCAGAPGPLGERAARYLVRARRREGEKARRREGEKARGREQLSAQLARAARNALQTVLAQPGKGERAVALDLLTADALVTLALKAKAEEDPGGLAGFAADLRGSGGQ
jgi:hypothetical protein